ncbi:MAG: class I SAM-dependent methyltransferase [Candidatus Marsarchaeota archaeon]|nr:class I SAM-dependent methyltransferase [Candidatus Marsarchaeota archaeon]
MSHGNHVHDSTEFYKMLLSEERRQWQDPEHILGLLELKPREAVADLACGPGFFSVPAALKVGGGGFLYCVDRDSEALKICAERLRLAGVSNYRVINTRLEELSLPPSTLDVALLANSLHDLEDPVLSLRRIRHSLKPAGRLGVVDWVKKQTPVGPPLDIRFSLEKSAELLEAAGFKVSWKRRVGPYHYMVQALNHG